MIEETSKPIKIGSVLSDRYELIKTIGKGGMGCVFMARHKQVGRIYAIKLLWKTKKDDEKTYKRFLQEAKIAGSLSHPNLTTVYDYGETEDGYPFIVMDFVDGISLRELLNREPTLELPRAINIFLQICTGLSYAHDKGLVHRDLKPANIMLVDKDGQEQVKIVDFGIAKMLVTTGSEIQDLTGTGEIFGSPFYASPEQCLGHKIDGRSDIYSLGCLMFETLTGHKPIHGENAVQTILMHIQDPPPHFAQVSPQQNLPEEIELIVLKCMDKLADNRYQSMADVAEDLEHCLDPGRNGSRKREIAQPVAIASARKPASSFIAPIAIISTLVAGAFLAFYLHINSVPVQHNPVHRVAHATVETSKPKHNEPATGVSHNTQPEAQGEPEKLTLKPESKNTVPSNAAEQVKETGAQQKQQPQKPADTKDLVKTKVSKTNQPAQHPATGTVAKPRTKTTTIAAAAPSHSEDERAAKLLQNLQVDLIPATVQEIDKITGSGINWDVDWSSFQNNAAALETFEYYGLEAIRQSIRDFSISHKGQEPIITRIRIKNVNNIFERQVVLKSGTLTISGAWGRGIQGSPTDLEINLGIAAGQ